MTRSSARWSRGDTSTERVRRTRQRGFTLIELMVVVLIIGLMAAGIVLSVGVTGRDTELEKESERAFQLIKYAREKAELQTREYGLYCGDRDYQFVTFDPRKQIWRPVDEDDALRARELPEGLKLRLVVEGRRSRAEGARREGQGKKKTKEEQEKELRAFQPHVMIFSNGDLTSFALTLERRGAGAQRHDQPAPTRATIEAGKLIEGNRT